MINTNELCARITPLLEQKRNKAVFNVPPPRINIVSPYPQYSQFQLNMRRKSEILKYTSSQQNTKSNSFTKNQKFANLAKISNIISQYQIEQPRSNSLCELNTTKPTLSTACNIPGPPIVLQYDPNIPLYNYGNYKDNRPYAIINKTTNATYNAYNSNMIEYIINIHETTLNPDIILDDWEKYTCSGNLGSLLIGDNSTNANYSFSISSPIALWFYGTYTDHSSSNDISLNIILTDITANVYYNDVLVTSKQVMAQSQDFNTITLSCTISEITPGLFYAIQYVGMLNINNLVIQTIPQTIYNIKYVANYTYNSRTVNTYFDFIKTGVFANLPLDTKLTTTNNCNLNSVAPNDINNGSFIQFVI